MKPKSAHEKIRSWLKSGKNLTPLTAWKMFSCYRVAAIIHRLRKNEGMNIQTKIIFPGKEYSYAQYSLIKTK